MATDLRLPKSVKRITVLRAEPETGSTSLTVYRNKKKRKKQTRGLRVLEKMARRNVVASETLAATYLGRHRRSNRKKRDGWLKDMAPNMFKANRKATKKLKLRKLLPGL